MPLFSNGPAVFYPRPPRQSIRPVRRVCGEPWGRAEGSPWPKKTEDTETVITMGYHGCCGVINWLYQVCYIMSKLPLCPGISMSLLWISLGNFYNYLGFPKMECFDPTDITRSLGPTFSSRPIFFAGSSCPVTSQRHEHWNREPSSDDWKYMEIHKMARKKLMIVSIKIGGGSEFCAWVSKKASSMGQRSIRFCTRLNTQVWMHKTDCLKPQV